MNYPVEIIIIRISYVTGYSTVPYLDQIRSSRLAGTQIKKNRLTRSNSYNKFKMPELEIEILHRMATIGNNFCCDWSLPCNL